MGIVTGRLDHVAIAADDTAALVRWYERVLGLVVHVEAPPNPPQKQKAYLIGPKVAPGRSALWQGMMIEIMPRNATPRHERRSHDPGLSHIAWYVTDFDLAYAHLQSCGVQFLGDVVSALGGGRLISFADSEGNMMQIVERK